MNYIHKLQERVAELEAEKLEAREELDALVSYLLSAKFSSDPTVQVLDVLHRIQGARNALLGD